MQSSLADAESELAVAHQPHSLRHPLTKSGTGFLSAALGALRHAASILYQNSLPLAVVVALLLIFPSPYLFMGFLCLPLFFMVRWIGQGTPFPKIQANIAVLILLAGLALNYLVAPDRMAGTLVVAHAVAGILMFYMVYDWAQGPRRRWLIAVAIVALGVVVALAAPFTTIWIRDKIFDLPAFYERVWPQLGERSISNNVVGGLEAAIPLALALIASGRRIGRLLGAVSLPPIIAMLVLIQSRSALIAVALGLVVYATFYRRWLLPLVPLTVLAALAVNSLVGAPLPTQKFYETNVVTAPENFQGRSEIWWQAAQLLARSPQGVGTDGFRAIAETDLAEVLSAPQRAHAHNLFLEIGLDTGVIGLGGFIVIAAMAIISAWRVYRRPGAGNERALAIGILAALTVIAIHGTLDTIFWGAKPGVIMWALLGVALSLGSSLMKPNTFKR